VCPSCTSFVEGANNFSRVSLVRPYCGDTCDLTLRSNLPMLALATAVQDMRRVDHWRLCLILCGPCNMPAGQSKPEAWHWSSHIASLSIASPFPVLVDCRRTTHTSRCMDSDERRHRKAVKSNEIQQNISWTDLKPLCVLNDHYSDRLQPSPSDLYSSSIPRCKLVES